MKIEIRFVEKDEESGLKKIKVYEVPTEKIIKGLTHISIFSFVGREINRVRPPRRNIGSLINWMTAAVISDAFINLVFPKKEEVEAKDDGERESES